MAASLPSRLKRCTCAHYTNLYGLQHISRRNANIFTRFISRKNKNYDPRKKTVVTKSERYARASVFALYGAFVCFLFVPGANYSVKSAVNDAFFERNAKKSDVLCFDSGVQCEILKKGYGQRPPNKKCSVYVHYEGSLLDGTIFTSTKHLNKAICTKLDSLIPGLAEAIGKMQIGEERQVFIPSHLAYFRNGKLNHDSTVNIPPNTPIIFNVQLCGIQ